MITHFHLLYYNHVKWAESIHLLNNERRFSVAEYFMRAIAALCILEVLTLFEILFHGDFIEKYFWWFAITVITLYLIIKFVLGANIQNRIRDLEQKYNRVSNWKKSGYRKRAFFYSFCHFLIFPMFILWLLVWFD